jgi:hypothetical protein
MTLKDFGNFEASLLGSEYFLGFPETAAHFLCWHKSCLSGTRRE